MRCAVADTLPGSAPISGAGKIPDMIWLANWGFGGGFKIITNKGRRVSLPPAFLFRLGVQERPNRFNRPQPPGAVPPVPVSPPLSGWRENNPCRVWAAIDQGDPKADD